MSELETMPLGPHGKAISRLGMGCWAVGGHGWGRVDEEEAELAIGCAFDEGVTFFDTADAYGFGKSEEMLARVLGKHRKEVVIATKGGVCWSPERGVCVDASPSYLRTAVEASLRRLELDHIPLYYLHKPDGKTPIEESVGELERLREQGKIGAIGISNFSSVDLTSALKTTPISAVQVRMNVFDREAYLDLVKICSSNGITLVAWGALADGLLTGKFIAPIQFPPDDHRSRMAEFKGERFTQRIEVVGHLQRMAEARNRQVGQLALRWVLDRSPVTSALFGAKTKSQVRQNLGGDGWKLSEEELTTIDVLTGHSQEVT